MLLLATTVLFYFQSIWRTDLLLKHVVAAGISKHLVGTVVRVKQLDCWRGTRTGIILRCIPPPLLWSSPQLTSAQWRAQNATQLHLFYGVIHCLHWLTGLFYQLTPQQKNLPFSVSKMTNYHSWLHLSSYWALLPKRKKKKGSGKIASGPLYIPTSWFLILKGIDEYNYIQYLCLLMFTDRFSHFISVSSVLCLFRC